MMYEQIIGRIVKCVSRDGTRITVTTGEFSEFSNEYKQILIKERGTNLPIIIAINAIDKIEVIEDD